MNPQTKPNAWSCIATSFAMALGIDTSELFTMLGHDGSEIISSLPDPGGRRGVHVQECIYVAMLMNRSVTPVELIPVLQHPCGRKTPVKYHGSVSHNQSRFERLIRTTQGVITGSGRRYGHAVAYDHGTIFEPDRGETFTYSQHNCESRGFFHQCLWIVS